jgi:hypothetical protein
MRVARDNSLSIFFLVIFLVSLAGQAIAGHGQFNHDQLLHHGDPISLGRYLTTSQFAADVAENWQSEYLQFTLYIVGTVWLLQRGSPESKPLDAAGRESDKDQQVGSHAGPRAPRWARTGGLRTALYGNSLLIVMTTIWLGSWLAQSIAGASGYNADQLDHQAATVSWLGSPRFPRWHRFKWGCAMVDDTGKPRRHERARCLLRSLPHALVPSSAVADCCEARVGLRGPGQPRVDHDRSERVVERGSASGARTRGRRRRAASNRRRAVEGRDL